jgi:hypothetical protein
MQMTGHKTRAVFERYNIVDEDDLFDAARKLESYSAAKVTGPAGKVTGKVATSEGSINPLSA